MRRVRVRGWWLLPLLAVAMFAAPWPAWMIEHGYTRRVYPRVQQVVTSFSNLTGAAVIDAGGNDVYRYRTGSTALRATRRLFAFSILYLFALFAVLLLDVVAKAIAPLIW